MGNLLNKQLSDLFEEWLTSRPGRGLRAGDGELSETSAQLYRDMWSVFSTYCCSVFTATPGKGLHAPLDQLSRANLLSLLADPATGARRSSDHPWSERYAWRMLHLIDRVLTFHADRQGTPKNNAAHMLLQEPPYRHANAAHLDASPELLSDGEVEQLISYLRATSGVEAQLVTTERPAAKPRWKPVRDAAVVATMLGAGLAPGDVQTLQMSGLAIYEGPEPGIPWRLTVPPDGLSPQHQTPLASWAGHVIAQWLAMRERLSVPGAYVFPSTLKGNGLSRMSCHRIAVGILDAAGLPGGVPFRLRHTFAVRQLSLGHSEEMVGRWLGLVESKAMRRYVALATPGTGVA